MASPDNRSYLDSHEWHMLDDDGCVRIGISEFAVEELTDITYVEVTHDSGPIAAGDTFGEIESVKATSDLYCGIDGEVVEVNTEVLERPELINEDPFDAGWIIKVRPTDPTQLDILKDAQAYDALHG